MEVLFAPQKEQARLSSDGQFLAYLGPSAAEVSNVVGSNLVRAFSFVNNTDMCWLLSPYHGLMLMDSEHEALCECQAAKANLELFFSCCIT
jgi:hypothetical protein